MLSEDIAALEAWVGVCADGTFELTQKGLAELQAVLGGLVERAERLERALDMTAEQLSPRRDRAAVEAAIASGKVEVLAARRVGRLPAAPGGLPDRRFGEDGPDEGEPEGAA